MKKTTTDYKNEEQNIPSGSTQRRFTKPIDIKDAKPYEQLEEMLTQTWKWHSSAFRKARIKKDDYPDAGQNEWNRDFAQLAGPVI